jgi:hypothetical protein
LLLGITNGHMLGASVIYYEHGGDSYDDGRQGMEVVDMGVVAVLAYAY